MQSKNRTITTFKFLTLSAVFAVSTTTMAGPKDRQAIIDHWTPERMANAIPRDMVIDKAGRGYIRRADGSLIPHGHDRLTEVSQSSAKRPMAKPGGSGDSDGPEVTPIEPLDGSTVGASQRFAANITDASGVRSASLVITYPSGSTQSFSLSNTSGDTWENSLSGFTDGVWSWHVEAKDNSGGRGNTTVSNAWTFTVDTNGGGDPGDPPSGDVVTNSRWTKGGVVQNAAGRIYFEMPSNQRRKRWAGYVCSGTVTNDGTSGRSVIITAAHCVYDDANKAFARNVLFIPNQDQTSGSGTDSNCSNDPFGCWTTSFGVVDVNWTTRTFPDNIPWDYAYYVVDDSGSHSGAGAGGALDSAVGSMNVSFATPDYDDGTASTSSPDFTHGLGYSYSDDPNFMYCAEDMTTEGSDNWWLPSCGLSGGSSGGPWVQGMNESTGDGPVMSVNSWGYSTSPGMAGPKLSGTSASCLYDAAKATTFSSVSSADGDAGVALSCN